MHLKVKNFHIYSTIFYIVISLCLTLIWLPGGEIVGGGDVGIPTYLPQRAFNLATNSWWETQASGTNNPLSYTTIPLYGFLSFLDKNGIGPDITQKGLIFIILSGGAISIYLLGIEYAFSKWASLLAGFFYIFNFTSLSVWHRGVHNAMLMLLLAPLSLLILSKGIRREKYSYIIWINVVSFFGSYVYGALGYLFALWLLWTVFLLINFLSDFSNSKRRKFILTYFLVLVISWLGSNLWWIIHFIESSRAIIGQFSVEELHGKSSSVLSALRPYHSPQYILRGLSGFYHYEAKEWGEFYKSPLLVFLSWMPSIIIFSTALLKTNYKSHFWRFLLALTTIVLIFSKGINPPLGLLNEFLMEYIPVLAPIRNPYEKIGIILAIPYSLLFSLGCYQLLQKIKKFYLKLFISGLIFVILNILVWPMWMGEIFHTEKSKFHFSVPSYYTEANDWFEGINNDTRILHLPLANGESIDYDWGYTGIEPSQLFFPGSSVSYLTGIRGVDALVKDLLISVHKEDTEKILKLLASLNVGWVVVHNETIWRSRNLEPVERINEWLKTNPYFLEYVKDIGPLSIWRVKDQYQLGHFHTIDGGLINLTQKEQSQRLKVWDKLTDTKEGFVIGNSDNMLKLEEFTKANLILPRGKFKFTEVGSLNTQTALQEIASIKYLQGTIIYNFINLKDKIIAFLGQDDQVGNCFKYASKRLAESVLLSRAAKYEEAFRFLDKFKNQIGDCSKIDKQTLNLYLSYPFLREEILGQLIRQRAILESEFKNSPISNKATEVSLQLNEYMAKINFYPKYTPAYKKGNGEVLIFVYDVERQGEYLIKIESSLTFDKGAFPIIRQIDDRVVNIIPDLSNDGKLIYASVFLTKGYHEIHLEGSYGNLLEKEIQEKINKLDSGFRFEIDPDTKEGIFIGESASNLISLNFNLANINVEETYLISFDAYIPSGVSPEFIIYHNTDPLDPQGNPKPIVKNPLGATGSGVWRKVEYFYTPLINSTKVRIAFQLFPNSTIFNNSSVFLIKNIKVSEILSQDLVMENSNRNYKKLGNADLKWKKITPTKYELNVKNQNVPYLLNFSETFHNNWRLYDEKSHKLDLPHYTTNGFANGWLVEDNIPSKIYVEFSLQKILGLGILLSIISVIITFGFIFYLDNIKKQNDK